MDLAVVQSPFLKQLKNNLFKVLENLDICGKSAKFLLASPYLRIGTLCNTLSFYYYTSQPNPYLLAYLYLKTDA